MIQPETIPFDPKVYGKGCINPDATSTAASVLTDAHYATLGIQGAWDAERVLRLCGWLQLTRYELSSLVMLPHQQMSKYMKNDLFPGPLCLLFSIIENQVVTDGVLDRIPEDGTPLIPNEILFNGPTKAS